MEETPPFQILSESTPHPSRCQEALEEILATVQLNRIKLQPTPYISKRKENKEIEIRK